MSRANLESRTLQIYYTRNSQTEQHYLKSTGLSDGLCIYWAANLCMCCRKSAGFQIYVSSGKNQSLTRASHWLETLGQCKNPEALSGSMSARKMGHSHGPHEICGGSVLAPWQQQGLAPVHFTSDIQMLSSSDSLCLLSVSRRLCLFVLAHEMLIICCR